MEEVYLGLGSNIGNRLENLKNAIKLITNHQKIEISKESSIYETKPFGYTDQPNFLNMVIEINTSLNPRDLLELLLNIETKLGRKREIHWGPRIIDIDILLYGEKMINEPDLQIPHPYIDQRLFVLLPLSEIYTGTIPPVSLEIDHLINRLDKNEGDVVKWTV